MLQHSQEQSVLLAALLAGQLASAELTAGSRQKLASTCVFATESMPLQALSLSCPPDASSFLAVLSVRVCKAVACVSLQAPTS